MQATINILGTDYVVDYDYRVTSEAHPATGPTYDCGGQPAEPMEFEIRLIELKADLPQRGEQFGLPVYGWLASLIVEHLQERDDVYDAIAEDHR